MRQKLVVNGLSPSLVDSLKSAAQINAEIALTAPVSGTITSRTVNAGQAVEANKEIMKVTDLTKVWVIAQVYEQESSRLESEPVLVSCHIVFGLIHLSRARRNYNSK